MRRWMQTRTTALAAAALLTLPLAGCGSGGGTAGQSGANQPPVNDYEGGRPVANSAPPQQRRGGLTTGQKGMLLVGAAALYYMYRKNQEKRQQSPQGEPQYYLSKNGQVYYRDANKRVHYVTPPQQGIRVPDNEARYYRDFEGYDGRRDGRTLLDVYNEGNYGRDPRGAMGGGY